MVILRCIDPLGDLTELQPGAVAVGFRERECYRFFARVDGACLYIDEAPAEPICEQGTHGWRWQPGFYAGQVLAELVGSTGQRLAEYRLDVAPDKDKMGAEVFHRMMNDLWAFDPALLLGTEAAQGNIGTSGAAAPLLLAYARLRRYGESLLTALSKVAAMPLTRLQHERALVPCHRVRRLEGASAQISMRRPHTAAFIHGGGILTAGAALFDVVLSADSLDHPANRTLAATLRAVQRRCDQVADALRRMAERDEKAGARTPLQPRLARKLEFLDGLMEKLARVANKAPFSAVSRMETTAAGLNVIAAHPAYARAHRFAWSALRPGVAGDDREESLWLSPSWEIYERWCFTRVVHALRARYGDLAWTMEYPRDTRSDYIKLVGEGTSMRIEAWLQPRFRAGGQTTENGFRSVSGELHPDIVITLQAANERKMLVLDAKYRTSRANVLDAMRSAHLYQDALRWDGQRPACSLLLVPRGGGAPWLEEQQFHRSNKVGVQVLTPESAPLALTGFLDVWLSFPSQGGL